MIDLHQSRSRSQPLLYILKSLDLFIGRCCMPRVRAHHRHEPLRLLQATNVSFTYLGPFFSIALMQTPLSNTRDCIDSM